MNPIRRALYFTNAAASLSLAGTSCESLKSGAGSSKAYDSVAYRPTNQSAVRVKVSMSNRAVYVMEGNRPLLGTATCGGTAAKPTPLGHFKAYNRLPRKRSNTYGFHIANSQPEDATIGKNIPRPTGYTDPDPPRSYLISSKYFDDLEPRGPLFAN